MLPTNTRPLARLALLSFLLTFVAALALASFAPPLQHWWPRKRVQA